MANLPLELVDLVCSFLTIDDLKNTLTVSRGFQYASERASGVYSEFHLTEDNVQSFLSLYSGRRWNYLRHVRFKTHIPPYRAKDYTEVESSRNYHCRESSEELREKDELFTSQINFVFTTLRSVEKQFSSGKIQLTIYTPIRDVDACAHRKSISWRLHLLTPDSLPELTSVRALCVEDPHPIYPLSEPKSLLKLDLRVLIDLAIKLPHLEFLGCKIGAGSEYTTDVASDAFRHYCRDWTGPHRDSRHNFAKALDIASLPPTLQEAQLDFLFPDVEATRIDQWLEISNLVSPEPYDLFSSGLRLLSNQLKRLDIKVVADSTLFWPSDGASSWPNLESICVLFHMSSPSGQWYFKGPGSSSSSVLKADRPAGEYPPLEDTDEDTLWDDELWIDCSSITERKFRIHPNGEVLVPFLTAFARAASTMTALKEACLWTPLRWEAYEVDDYGDYDSTQIAKYPDSPLAWGITYLAPNTRKFNYSIGESLSTSRQLWWGVGHWRPDDDLRRLFQQVGNLNAELIEYWGHEQNGGGLVSQTVYDAFQVFGWRHPNKRWPLEPKNRIT